MHNGQPLWDWPTRLCHWCLAAAVPLAWWTGEEGHTQWHEWLGYAVLVLVVFRVVWGFVGSNASRFSAFVSGPRGVVDYIGRGMREPPSASPGHNPLGGWYVLAVLGVLLVQAASGLFNSDEIFHDGPLHHLVDSQWQDWFGELHETAFKLLLGLIAVHLLAVAWHQWGRGEPLIQAMFRGRANGREGRRPPAPGWLAVVIVLVLAVSLWLLLRLVPAPVSPW